MHVTIYQCLHAEDESYYRCIFNAFPHGSFSKDICLNVQSKFSTHTFLLSGTWHSVESELCSATGKPPPKIIWLRDKHLDEPSKVHHIQNTNGTVTVVSRHTFPREKSHLPQEPRGVGVGGSWCPVGGRASRPDPRVELATFTHGLPSHLPFLTREKSPAAAVGAAGACGPALLPSPTSNHLPFPTTIHIYALQGTNLYNSMHSEAP
uniref:Ig-like domain-containing protein n=1 Tax=Apteryx owenii TaxID=8824 RepID=A0A8B9Q763_APTOW